MKKTNAARLLDRLGIDYELLEYRVDEQDLSAEHVAQELDLPAEQVFKTIVLRGDKTGVFVCCIPGNGESTEGAARHRQQEGGALSRDSGLTGYVRRVFSAG